MREPKVEIAVEHYQTYRIDMNGRHGRRRRKRWKRT